MKKGKREIGKTESEKRERETDPEKEGFDVTVKRGKGEERAKTTQRRDLLRNRKVAGGARSDGVNAGCRRHRRRCRRVAFVFFHFFVVALS